MCKRRSTKVDGSVHLGRVECPVREPNESHFRLLEQSVEYLEGVLLRLLSKPELV